MVVISQVGCNEIAPIILGYGNGARFRTLRSTTVENPRQRRVNLYKSALFYAKQSQFSKKSNGCKFNYNKGI